MAATHGPVTNLPTGGTPTLLLADPGLIRQVLQTNKDNYVQSPRTEKFKAVLGNGLLTNDGESWFAQRRLIQPAFHHHRLEVLTDTIADVTRRRVATWAGHVSRGQPLDLHAALDDIARRVIVNAMFGMDLPDARYDEVKRALAEVSRFLNGRLWESEIDLTDGGAAERFAQAVLTLDETVYDMIDARREAPGEDLLSMLIAAEDADTGARMGDQQLRDETLTIFRSGHETVAMLMTWIFLVLDRHPAQQARLRDELDTLLDGRDPTFADLPKLEVLQQVIDETLRLYPPAWMISRKAVEADEMGGYAVPEGATVLLSPYVMHRHPDLWDRPDEFVPERFESTADAPKRDKFAWFPFGGGQRQCIGRNLAMMEVKMVVAMVCQRHRLITSGTPDTTPVVQVLLRPRDTIRMRLRPA